MKCKITTLATVAGLFVGALMVQAQTLSTNQQSGSQSSSSSSTSGMQSSDQSSTSDMQSERIAQSPSLFIQKANQDNLTEIQLGQLAQQKGQSQKVKDYGQALVKDHQALNEKLQQLAKQKGIECTNKLDSRSQMKVDRLTAYSGEEFDKNFMEQQAKAHKEDVALFEQVATKSTDNDIKQFAQTTLPDLRHHLQMAQSGNMVHEPAGAQGGTNSPESTTPETTQPQPQQPDSSGSGQSTK